MSIAQRADREACVNGMRIFSTFGRGICPTWPFGAITAKMGGQANFERTWPTNEASYRGR